MLHVEPMFGDFIGEWHRVFCILPKKTYDGRLIWFKTAWRRRVQLKSYLDEGPQFWWFYSLENPFDNKEG